MKEKNSIILTLAQRNLLLKYEPYFIDPALFRLISVAIKKGKIYEIWLNDSQMDELLDQISELSNNEDNEIMQNKLDDLCDYLSELYDEEDSG